MGNKQSKAYKWKEKTNIQTINKTRVSFIKILSEIKISKRQKEHEKEVKRKQDTRE